ncbi:MAG: hypothetical protein IJ876_06495 [Elusimicrobiaceae bacterium]|nr:hypothetical protein [Elusimicrobiaceae bacterium]
MKLSHAVCLLVFILSSFPAFSQTQLIEKPLSGSFIRNLRAGGQAYMVPNMRIGKEVLEAGIRSRIGLVPLTRKEKMQYRGYELCAPRLNEAKLQRLVERQLIKEPFPAYYTHFEKEWNRVQLQKGIQLSTLEVILDAAYGEETEFEGAFVPAYREIVIALQQEQEGFTSRAALKNAFTQALQLKSGFFVITVHENAEHGHDVLLLDLKKLEFISLGKSIGAVWVQPTIPDNE